MTAIANVLFKRLTWKTVIAAALAFWISGSLLLDLVIMPTLYASGMMSEVGFAAAGYSVFWIFNRIELLCAALVLTGALVMQNAQSETKIFQASQTSLTITFSAILLAIALIYTYFLSPEMSALGIQLNLFEPAAEVPATMNQLHGSYWVLELVKLCVGGVLLQSLSRQPNASAL